MPNKRKSASKGNDSTGDSKQRKLTNNSATDFSSVEKLYGFKMPNDFSHFWKLCLEIEPKNPLDAFSFLDWKLVGPFYYLYHKPKASKQSPASYHLKWRYYYDTPEFLTVITTTHPDKELFHIGYFRDDPSNAEESIVVSNSGTNAQLSILGDNLFGALKKYLFDMEKRASGKILEKSKYVMKKVQEYADAEKFSLKVQSEKVEKRRKKTVATTFHKIGLVVPIIDEVGYRPLPHDNRRLKTLLEKVDQAGNDDERLDAFEPLQEIVTFIQFANDECDYGMGLEFGLALFCHGSKDFAVFVAWTP